MDCLRSSQSTRGCIGLASNQWIKERAGISDEDRSTFLFPSSKWTDDGYSWPRRLVAIRRSTLGNRGRTAAAGKKHLQQISCSWQGPDCDCRHLRDNPGSTRRWTERLSCPLSSQGSPKPSVRCRQRSVLVQAKKGGSVIGSELTRPESPLQGVESSPPRIVECFEIEGGARLEGHVTISGAKNSALAVLAGALCCNKPLTLRMIPDLHDVRRMFQVMESMGVKIRRGVDGSSTAVSVDASSMTSVAPCPDAARKLRASLFVIGALVGRYGEAVVPLPGGCNIGARPIDFHVRGLRALNADVEIRQGKVHARARNGKRLVGGFFHMDKPSVGATETLMMAACLAEGESVLSNTAQEPEVVDLAHFLISCGAKIKGAGTNCITIQGVPSLGGTDFTVIPDRIEAGTFLVAAAVTRSAIHMSPVCPSHLTAVTDSLMEAGCRIIQTRPHALKVIAPPFLKGLNVTTGPHPGFPTDCQPQLMTLLTTCGGMSTIKETVFESRMRHVEELQKMGALIKVAGSTAIISGGDQGSALYGAPVTATDLRAGASLVLAGMAAESLTQVKGVSHIDRGYEHLDEKLRMLGAQISRRPCLPAELDL